MQLVHLLGGRRGAPRCSTGSPPGLHPVACSRLALLAEQADAVSHGNPPLPDVLERDGWVYSSLPLEVRDVDGRLELRRLRQIVSPQGAFEEEVDVIALDGLDARRFEAEASGAGLVVRERVEIAAPPDHVGSIVCMLEAGR